MIKRLSLILAVLFCLVGCGKSSTKKDSTKYFDVSIWKDDKIVDTLKIEENSTVNIEISKKRITYPDEEWVYLKPYHYIDGFYSPSGTKYFNKYGKPLFNAWTSLDPLDLIIRYVDFDDYQFFKYENYSQERRFTSCTFILEDYEAGLCQISPNAYLNFDLTFEGKSENYYSSMISYEVYDDVSGSECFYQGLEYFESYYTSHHVTLKIPTLAGINGRIIFIFEYRDAILKVTNELLTITYSLN